MGVGDDPAAMGGGGLYGGGHFGLGQFLLANLGSQGQDGACGDQLDAVDAVLEQVVHLAGHILRASNHPHPHVGWNDDIWRESRHFTAAARNGDVGADRIDPGPWHVAAVNGVPQGDVGEGPEIADIVHCGEACLQGDPGMTGAQIGNVGVGVEQGFGHIVGLVSISQVDVAVDQPGQDLITGPVHHRAVLGRAGPGRNRRHPTIHHLDQLVVQDLFRLRVHQAADMDISWAGDSR